MQNIVHKAARLADSYFENEIDREAYLALKAHYDGELRRLRDLLEREKSEPVNDRRTAMSALLNALAAGRAEEDAVYLSLVERIETAVDGALEITLRGMTEKLRAALK